MTEAGSSTVRPTQGGDSAVYRAFHEYQWDLDKDFLVSTKADTNTQYEPMNLT